MSPEDEPVSPLHGATCTGHDVAGDTSGSNTPDKQRRAPGALPSIAIESTWYCLILPLPWRDATHAHRQPQLKSLYSNLSFSHEDLARGESPFLKILMDAEAAANAASIQLVSFKEALENECSVCCRSELLYNFFLENVYSASMMNPHNAVYF